MQQNDHFFSLSHEQLDALIESAKRDLERPQAEPSQEEMRHVLHLAAARERLMYTKLDRREPMIVRQLKGAPTWVPRANLN